MRREASCSPSPVAGHLMITCQQAAEYDTLQLETYALKRELIERC